MGAAGTQQDGFDSEFADAAKGLQQGVDDLPGQQGAIDESLAAADQVRPDELGPALLDTQADVDGGDAEFLEFLTNSGSEPTAPVVTPPPTPVGPGGGGGGGVGVDLGGGGGGGGGGPSCGFIDMVDVYLDGLYVGTFCIHDLQRLG